ncbi:MAG TPA: tol-pal system protein YbgF [Nitrospiraceae bacterium]|nr:tol-pal system protein YbgF [Nitrospiraceae bacterium]
MKAIITLFLVFLCAVSLPATASAQTQDSSRRLYDRVMDEVRHKDYEAALAGFRLFLEMHPRSSLASSAQYWIGECEFRLRRYTDALTSFYDVMSRYPKSPKHAGATLKIGLIYAKLGQQKNSRIVLERVVDQFPNTPEAEVALKHLGRSSDVVVSPPVSEGVAPEDGMPPSQVEPGPEGNPAQTNQEQAQEQAAH